MHYRGLTVSLIEHIRTNIDGVYPFHMPGHKGQKAGPFPHDLDITELGFSDNLQNPTGIIKSLEKRVAETFGAYQSLISVNGSTAGVLAAMLYSLSDGNKIVCARNAHVSLFRGLCLSGGEPVYVMPMLSDYFCGSVNPADIKAELIKHPTAKAVFVTSPTYEGVVSDIKSLAALAHEYDMLLIVDEAHGAHLGFNDFFPESAVRCGADIVIQSLHKTLPAMNPLAVIHISQRIDSARFRNCLNMVQTTSPSYVLLSSLDNCLTEITKPGLFETFAQRLKDFRHEMTKMSGSVELWEKKTNDFRIYDCDPSKLIFLGNGTEIYSRLEEEHKIRLEMHSKHYGLAMSSVWDSDEGFGRLLTAVKELSRDRDLAKRANGISGFSLPKAGISPRKALQTPSRRVKISEGLISGGFITPYPPGIPLVSPGEVIDSDVIKRLQECLACDIEVMGLYHCDNNELFIDVL